MNYSYKINKLKNITYDSYLKLPIKYTLLFVHHHSREIDIYI